MVEPTESEPKEEMDRFIEALVQIKRECEASRRRSGQRGGERTPHTARELAGEWTHPPLARSRRRSCSGGSANRNFSPRVEDRQRPRRPQPLLPQLRMTAISGMKNGGGFNIAAVFSCYGTIISCYYLATCPEVRTFDGLRNHFRRG